MTMTEHSKRHGIDWICVQRSFFFILAFGFTFAAGGWLVSIRDQEASLPYLQRSTKTAEQVKAVAGPNPVATIKCERHKAAVASTKLNQAIAANEYVDVPTPSAALPSCPPPPAVSKSVQK